MIMLLGCISFKLILEIELGRCTITIHCIVTVIHYWLKVIYCEDRTFIKQV